MTQVIRYECNGCGAELESDEVMSPYNMPNDHYCSSCYETDILDEISQILTDSEVDNPLERIKTMIDFIGK